MKRRIILYVSGGILVVALIIAGRLFIKNDFKASEDFATAELSLNITQNDQATIGAVFISGDCPETELPASDGTYYCRLVSSQVGATTLNINSLAFYNFADDLTSPIQLSTSQATEPQPYLLPANTKLTLDVVIGDGKITVTRWNETTRQDEPFPAPDPED